MHGLRVSMVVQDVLHVASKHDSCLPVYGDGERVLRCRATWVCGTILAFIAANTPTGK